MTKVGVANVWISANLACHAYVAGVWHALTQDGNPTGALGKVFLLLFAVAGRLAEIKFCNSLPEAIKGSLGFQGFYKFSESTLVLFGRGKKQHGNILITVAEHET